MNHKAVIKQDERTEQIYGIHDFANTLTTVSSGQESCWYFHYLKLGTESSKYSLAMLGNILSFHIATTGKIC
jgi:hypothetical protein